MNRDYPQESPPPPDPLLDRIERLEQRLGSCREAATSISERLDGIENMLGAAEGRTAALFDQVEHPGLAMPAPQPIGRSIGSVGAPPRY